MPRQMQVNEPNVDWHPSATLSALRLRAKIIAKIRAFFAKNNILEVTTPLLTDKGVTDPYLKNFQVPVDDQILYLQTSPEYAMKRLLCAGSGPIYQICQAFRFGDSGTCHQPEFTMLEWYRPNFEHMQLMDEIDLLLKIVLTNQTAKRISYQDIFAQHLQINPHTIPRKQLITCVQQKVKGLQERSLIQWPHTTLLECLFSHCIQPKLGHNTPLFIYDYPEKQAALAKLRTIPHQKEAIAERFELFINGIELANGYHELTDPEIYRLRFEQDNRQRLQNKQPTMAIDHKLLRALEQGGLPTCAGVALGLDRLVMVAGGYQKISEVISL